MLKRKESVGDDGEKKFSITRIISRQYFLITQSFDDDPFSAPDNSSSNLYSLTWTCKFPNNNDTYYFAHCYPYTYSDLQVETFERIFSCIDIDHFRIILLKFKLIILKSNIANKKFFVEH